MRLYQGNVQPGAWEQQAGGAGPPWHVNPFYWSMWCNPLGQGRDLYDIANKIVANPLIFGKSYQYNRIGCYVAYNPGTQADNIRLGIYDDDITKVYPGKLLCDSGVINIPTGTTGIISATIDFKPGAGRLYWIVFTHSQVNPGELMFVGTYRECFPGILGYAAMGDRYGFFGGYQISRAFQALPDPFPGGATSYSLPPALGVRYVT